jgi:hypothetical protein
MGARFLTWSLKKGKQNRLCSSYRYKFRFKTARHTDGFFFAKYHYLSIKSHNSSRTLIKNIGFSVQKTKTFITIVKRK